MKQASRPTILVRLNVMFCLLLVTSATTLAQSDDWSEPFPGHRIIANLYAVGTHGLGVFLITSDEGHILINTGLEDSAPMIRRNVESLGFQMHDIKILLTMQAHWDHAAAMAEIKEITGAEMWATKGDAILLRDGGFSDPLFGGKELFNPVAVEKIIDDGDVIELGKIRLQVYEHPGHTLGSSSYAMKVRENGREYNVAIANMGTMNPGTKLLVDPTYPGIANDLARTYASQKNMQVDVWVAAHGFQYGQHEKFKPGQAYSPDTFVDPAGFLAAIEQVEDIYLQQIAAEKE